MHRYFEVNSRINFTYSRHQQFLTYSKGVIGFINYLQLRTYAMVSSALFTLAGVNG